MPYKGTEPGLIRSYNGIELVSETSIDDIRIVISGYYTVCYILVRLYGMYDGRVTSIVICY